MYYILSTIGIVALIYLGVCIIYYIIQEKFIFVPTLPGEPFESRLATPSEEVFIDTPNNGKIHALILKTESPKGVVFYLHGNTGSLKRWQFMAEEVSSYGYDVFVMDYRGYGRSKGKRSEAVMHKDAEFCFDWLLDKYKESKTVIYGRSLGSGFATKLASRKKCDLLVLETPFYNFPELARFYLPFLPVKYLLRYKFRSDIHIRNVDSPILILHGTKDIVVPYKSALQLFRDAENHARQVSMTTIVGGKHGNLNSFPLFREKMSDFLK
jgi:uncharacterized protein